MGATPDVLKHQIDHTRGRLDRDLDRLDTQIAIGKERLIAASQWWFGVIAIAAGAIGTVAFWPRRHRRVVRLIDVSVGGM